MTILTYAEMQRHLRDAGFTSSEAVIGSAVGMAESSGRTDAINYVPCVGFMQINQRAHPEYSIAQLEDPATNARAARKVYLSQGWAAWTTYTSGAYKRYLNGANRAIPAGGPHADTRAGKAGAKVGQQAASTVQSLQSLNALAGKLNDPKFWTRTAYVIIGIVLIMMGILSMTASQRNIKLAAQIAKVAVVK